MLNPVIFDRFTMGFSLAVHILLAVVGVALPVLILLAEYLSIKYKDRYYALFAKRMTTVLIILFAVGTASGTLVAMNLLFLWPKFMVLVGKVAILPVYVETFAFFCETIFIALYVYSRRLFENSYKHVAIMGIVAFGGLMSAILITILNAFMNTPVGFNVPQYLSNGNVTNVNPLAVFTSPSAAVEVAHVVASSYFTGSFIFLAYFAFAYLKSKDNEERKYYNKAIKLCFALALVGVLASIVTGVLSIESIFQLQPEKFAAMELDLVSQAHAPEILFGMYSNNAVQYGIAIPYLQSFLAGHGNLSAVVPGLSQFPQNTWPPLFIHDLFDLMVFLGFAIGFFMLVVLAFYLMKKDVFGKEIVLQLFIFAGVASVLLLENGWMVDEIGRQPWIIYNVMKVSQAANQSQSVIPIAIGIVLLYAFIMPLTGIVLKRIFAKRKLGNELRM